MKEITFYKMVASGNDFVVIDNRKGMIQDPVSFTREVCSRHTGVGGDGLLLLETSGKADLKMRILNADGSEAEACGNGFRCVALLANERLGLSRKQRFETLSGMVECEVRQNRIRVRLGDPADFKDRETIDVCGRELHYYFLRVGVPHVVIFVEGLAKVPVLEVGKAIRSHGRFQPAGTNVNFVELRGPQSVQVRTYERGVEGETLACGTGAAASAIVSVRTGYVQSPVKVKTQGGEVLKVDFTKKGEKIQEVYLEGEARLVFEGKMRLENEQVLI